jgi:peroxiredoxin
MTLSVLIILFAKLEKPKYQKNLKRKKLILFVYLFWVITNGFSQKKTNLILEFPANHDYKQSIVIMDNGRTEKIIALSAKQNTHKIRRVFYSKYAAITILYKNPDISGGYYGKSFFVNELQSNIRFKKYISKKNTLENYNYKNCIPFDKAGAAEMRSHTNEIAGKLNEFISRNSDYENDKSLKSVLDSLNSALYIRELDFIKKNSQLYYCFWTFRNQYAQNTAFEPSELLHFFNSHFPDSFTNSTEGREVLNIINGRLLSKGQVAPNFIVQDISNNKISLDKFKGKKILLHFWASWCKPSLKELVHIKKIYNQCDTSKIVVISFTKDYDYLAFNKALKKYEMTWINIFDSESVINKYNVDFLPKLFLINESGIIIYKSDEELEEDINLSILLGRIVSGNRDK